MKRRYIALGALLLFALFAWIWVSQNKMKLMARQVDKAVASMVAAQQISDTRFEVIFCGTGTPQYNPDRSQPCLGVIAGGRFFLFDAGQGAAQQLQATQSPYQKLDTVFLTHLHSDHMSGLGDVLHNGWLTGRQDIVEVVGPPGTQRLIKGIQLSFQDDIEERQRVLGAEYLNTGTALGLSREVVIDTKEAMTVFDQDGVIITAFQVDHPDWPHAYGYKVEFGGKSIVISGDTKYTSAIGQHARGVDYLIHESINTDMMDLAARSLQKHGTGVAPERMALITEAHTPTLEVAKAAVDAKAKTLVLTHHIPPIPANKFVESIYIKGMDEIYKGEIIMARDGMRLTLIE